MPLVNREISILLSWYANRVISAVKGYVPVVALLTKDNANLLKQLKLSQLKSEFKQTPLQLKSGFKRTIDLDIAAALSKFVFKLLD